MEVSNPYESFPNDMGSQIDTRESTQFGCDDLGRYSSLPSAAEGRQRMSRTAD